MSDKPHAVGEYQSVPFEVTGYRWEFHVPSLNRSFGTYEQMTTGIDSSLKALEKAERKKLSINAIDENGNDVMITGVHAGHGKIITTPKIDSRWARAVVYAKIPVVLEALSALEASNLNTKRIEAVLKRLQIRTGLSDYGFDISQHERAIAGIESSAGSAMKFAKGKTLEKLVASIGDADADEFDD